MGNIGGVDYSGDSCVIDPNGEILMESSRQDGVLEYELTDDVNEFRTMFQVKRDRREELYCTLL